MANGYLGYTAIGAAGIVLGLLSGWLSGLSHYGKGTILEFRVQEIPYLPRTVPRGTDPTRIRKATTSDLFSELTCPPRELLQAQHTDSKGVEDEQLLSHAQSQLHRLLSRCSIQRPQDFLDRNSESTLKYVLCLQGVPVCEFLILKMLCQVTAMPVL